jgi:hypothetical protein
MESEYDWFLDRDPHIIHHRKLPVIKCIKAYLTFDVCINCLHVALFDKTFPNF